VKSNLKRVRLFKTLPRLDLAEDEIRANQDQGIAPEASSSGKLLTSGM
jgi:hypothetical protein